MADDIKKNVVEDEEDWEDEVVTLVAEDGTETDYYELATFDFENKWYIVFEPAVATDGFEEGDVVIYELKEDEKTNEQLYLPIEDEAELNRVFDEFNRMLGQECDGNCNGCNGDGCDCEGK